MNQLRKHTKIKKKTHVMNSHQLSFLLVLFVLLSCLPNLSAYTVCHTALYDFEIVVSDMENEPLIGVNIYTKDQTFATTTDLDGKAVLKNLTYQSVLQFSYIGYQAVEYPFYEIRKLGGIIKMKPDITDLETIVVIGRRDDKPEDIPYNIESIDQKTIALTNAQTAADALEATGNVFVQKSQMGGGSPVLRGFEANKVLLVLDGVRLNNAIYRNGHLQNSITVDNATLERAEVIFGPGSLMYGSDALGGVVHYRTKDPQLNFESGYTTSGSASVRTASANFEKNVHLDLNYGTDRWASLTSFSFVDYDNLKSGKNGLEQFPEFQRRHFVRRRNGADQIIYNGNIDLTTGDTLSTNYEVQVGTEYTQFDFLEKIRYQPNNNIYFITNIQYSSSSNVPRYDNLTEYKNERLLKFSEWYYGPQQRFLFSTKARLLKANKIYDKGTIIGAFQRIAEERYSRKFGNLYQNYNLEDVYVYSLTADFDKYIDSSEKNRLSYGFDVNNNKVFSEAGRKNIRTAAVILDEPSRYPSNGSSMNSAGFYANTTWNLLNDKIILNGGIRGSHVKLKAKFSAADPIAWDTTLIQGVENTGSDLTWAGGLTLKPSPQTKIQILAASAFRFPNIDDWAKIRENNGFVTVPNPELGSEVSQTYEATINHTFGQVNKNARTGVAIQLNATGFYTNLQNVIVRENFLLNGSPFLANRGDTLYVQANINADNGQIKGLSGSVKIDIANKVQLASTLSFTDGVRSLIDIEASVDTLVPLAHIPPLYGRTTLTFKGHKGEIALAAKYNAAKPIDKYAVTGLDVETGQLDRGGSSDNLELATSTGIPAWVTYNIYSSFNVSEKITINLAAENLLDTHYRVFSSGVSGAGRNFIASFKYNF